MFPKINPNPRFTHTIVKSGCLAEAPLTVVDVGASLGCPAYWDNFMNQIRFIGFEPNPDEFEKCTQTADKKFYPIALGKQKELRTLTITHFPYSSSTLPFDMNFWRRFPCSYLFEPVGTETFETIDFDSFCTENGINNVDVMKLDTEGTELEILEGSISMLDKGIIAIIVEVAFHPYHLQRPVFADVDSFLRNQGFTLFDLETTRFARTSLPPLETLSANGANYGQLVAGDALYMVDLVTMTGQKNKVSPLRIIKAICLFELFSLNDCAIELLEFALANSLLPQEFSCTIDLLVPPVFNRYISLEHHRSIFRSLPQLP
jgi:FkbM family methyltransferase